MRFGSGMRCDIKWLAAGVLVLAGLVAGDAAISGASASGKVSYCVQKLRSGNNDLLKNSCTFKIIVKWRDQGYCASGCTTFIAPGAQNGITHVTGAMMYGACRYPDAPVYGRGDTFSCR